MNRINCARGAPARASPQSNSADLKRGHGNSMKQVILGVDGAGTINS